MDLFDQLKYSSHGGKKRKPSSDKKFDHSTNNLENSNKLEGKSKNDSSKQKSEHSSTKKNGDKKVDNKSKNLEQRLAKFNDKHKSRYSSSRRESMPSPVTYGVLSKSKKKSRSLSPPKYTGSAVIKSLKVKLERKNLEDFLKSPLVAKSNNVKSKQHKHKGPNEPNQKSPLKATPTKAQQKLFEPIGSKRNKDQTLKEFNIKKCEVRIRRDNFKKLMLELKKNRVNNKSNSKQPSAKTLAKPRKRLALSDDDGSPPPKKGKIPPVKRKMNFFFKISPHKSEKKSKSSPRTSSSSSVAHHNKIKNSKSTGVTTPTKFSRSHLIRTFGKRFFTSFVRIEKCHHPLLLTFESNDRARRLQAKRNKSKNLSVSFREQVEVFGSSSDSDNSYDENFCAIPRTNQKGGRRSSSSSVALAIASATPVVMPARLKKVENGKVVDDIELDPSLFLDPKNLVASSPYTPGRKKRDHKSFSPLKDEGTPSPRKEKLKLANEKIPPSGLRRLNIDDDDDDDDDCEYIVPIELPQRRTSRTSSINTLDGGPTLFPPTPETPNVSDSCSNTQDKNIEIEADKTETPKEADPAATETISPQNVDVALTPIVSTSSPTANVSTSPIPTSDIPDSAEPEASPEINDETEIPICGGNNEAETEKAQPQEDACNEETESHDSFHSASDHEPQQKANGCDSNIENRPTSLSPTSALNDVVDGVVASAIDTGCETKQTQDMSELDLACEMKQTQDKSELDSACETKQTQDMSELDSACETKQTQDKSELDAACETNQTQDKSELDSACETKQMQDKSELDLACKQTQDKSELDLAYKQTQDKSELDLACKQTQDKSQLDSACEAKQTHDMSELNGTGVSTNELSMNLFLEDDSQDDGDGPDKSFVDSIINETIDKLGKDIEESSPVDEQPTHTT